MAWYLAKHSDNFRATSILEQCVMSLYTCTLFWYDHIIL